MRMKRTILYSVGIVVILLAGVIVLADGTVLENWRMRRVASMLESVKAVLDTKGNACSFEPLEHGLQPAMCFGMRSICDSRFRMHGSGVARTVWVQWSKNHRGVDIRLHKVYDRLSPESISIVWSKDEEESAEQPAAQVQSKGAPSD